jgi:DNA-binding GntR family transcriptional regulator
MSRSERGVVWARMLAARAAGRITAAHLDVGGALLRRLGADGQLDPSHSTLAADAKVGERTVRRALARFRDLGLVLWVRRIVRAGCRVWQTSNAYALLIPAVLAGGQSGLGRRFKNLKRAVEVVAHTVADDDRQTALAALARIRRNREAELSLR